MAMCVLSFSVAACGATATTGSGQEGQEPPLPSATASPAVTSEAVEIAPEECPETMHARTDSAEPTAESAQPPSASSCGKRATPLTEDQMRSATPAPMPIQPRPEGSGTP